MEARISEITAIKSFKLKFLLLFFQLTKNAIYSTIIKFLFTILKLHVKNLDILIKLNFIHIKHFNSFSYRDRFLNIHIVIIIIIIIIIKCFLKHTKSF